jgi:hypothetical protein
MLLRDIIRFVAKIETIFIIDRDFENDIAYALYWGKSAFSLERKEIYTFNRETGKIRIIPLKIIEGIENL